MAPTQLYVTLGACQNLGPKVTQDSGSETDPKISDFLIFRLGCFRNFAEAGRRASLLDLHFFGLLHIQSYRIARYSSFFGPLDTQEFRAAGYSDFSGRSIFKLIRLLDIESAFRLLDA